MKLVFGVGRLARAGFLGSMFVALGCNSGTGSAGQAAQQPTAGTVATPSGTAGSPGSPASSGSGAPPLAGSGPVVSPQAGTQAPAGGSTAVGAAAGTPAPAAGSGAAGMATAGTSAGAAAGGAGGAAGTTAPTTYPMLDGATIGSPSQVAMGFTLAEGPVWDHCNHQLLFVDVEAKVINKLGADGKVAALASDTNWTNGMAFDLDGSLILAQMGGADGHGRLARRDASGTITVLFDKDPQGAAFHTVDDVTVGSDGTIYFSDGDFAHGTTYTAGIGLNYTAVYAGKPGAGGMGTLLKGDTVRGPNGIRLSPDEKTLYVDAYFENTVYKYSPSADGTAPKKGAAFVTGVTNADSLCLDAGGNLYVGTMYGLQVVRPDGTKVKTIPITSAKGTTNCAFGGEDGKTLYITAWTGLWKVEGMPIPGLDWTINQTRVQCK